MTPPIRIEVLGVPKGGGLAGRISTRLARSLVRLPFRATGARVRFCDDSGPKGGAAIRCALSVRIPRRPAVHVEHVAASPRPSFDGALAKLERRLARSVQARRENRRHPKKYFAAVRALRS